MLAAKRQILIAAPTITEITRSTDFPALPPPSVPNVLVVAFDLRAALVCAEKFPEQVIKNEQQSTGLFLNYLRYDALILACAIRYEAVLVTLEAPMTKLAANAGLECKRPEDFDSQLGMKAYSRSHRRPRSPQHTRRLPAQRLRATHRRSRLVDNISHNRPTGLVAESESQLEPYV